MKRPSVLTALVLAAATLAAPLSAQGLAGSYLAGRQAIIANDFTASAEYFSQALRADPANPALMENAVRSFLGAGDLGRAVEISLRMAEMGVDSQIAWMALLGDDFRREDYATALDDLDTGDRVGPLVDGLLTAWATVGLGEFSTALEQFDAAAATEGVEAFGFYHKALAYALVGDYESADAILSGEISGNIGLSRRGIVTHAQVLSQLERNDDAIAMIDAAFPDGGDDQIAALRMQLAAGERLDFDMIESARDGAAEVFFMVGGALAADADANYVLMYARIAQALRPGHIDALLLTASLLDRLQLHDLAAAAYAEVPRDHPSYLDAEIGRAEALYASGNTDAAVEVLEQLSRDFASSTVAHVALGDALRRLERYAPAASAYDKAIATFDSERPEQWLTYFARGVSREQTEDWPGAESDFRKALSLNPEQPQVLNYLGYSYVEMNENMDEALDLIERAVAAQPNSGYIVDSLGWALFKTGDYPGAVTQLERAVELVAVDPVINDHLGDAYWAVGRKLEARFQWRRALSFDPEETDAERIRRKLEVGLDQVRAAEGEAPIAVANDG
ncbi:tetratricopeptide repeat protein [Anianabacter salinae]|uniref:tetratricopeptide repeat protein n=1 Tax=Anianabacter salinae TaxID=2851023 RepID=UPI00225DE2B3|nr:tetratricopeptide repeat protein [Anianabacter salinae]MBV0913248.1 tetratricopeptide repeat protein [Anianabacter salinae]